MFPCIQHILTICFILTNHKILDLEPCSLFPLRRISLHVIPMRRSRRAHSAAFCIHLTWYIYILYIHIFLIWYSMIIYIYYINTQYTSYVYIYIQYVLMSTLKTRCSRIQRGIGWWATPRWMLTALSEREPFPWKTPSSTSGARIQGRMSTTLEKTLLGTVNKCNNIHIYICICSNSVI
jgi:hypothetical protein